MKEVSEENFPWKATKSTQPIIESHLSRKKKDELAKILKEFEDVMQGKPGQTSVVEHAINTGEAEPIRVHPYRIPYAYRKAVAEELAEMVESRIIEPLVCEWAAPIVVVKKKDGNLRLCVDYRKLNAITPMDAYPMLRMHELLDRMGKARYISMLDLARG